MNNTQLLFSIGIPSVLVIMAWISNNTPLMTLEKRIDGLDNKFDRRVDALDKRFDGLDKRITGLDARWTEGSTGWSMASADSGKE